jgi:hypothetical protein
MSTRSSGRRQTNGARIRLRRLPGLEIKTTGSPSLVPLLGQPRDHGKRTRRISHNQVLDLVLPELARLMFFRASRVRPDLRRWVTATTRDNTTTSPQITLGIKGDCTTSTSASEFFPLKLTIETHLSGQANSPQNTTGRNTEPTTGLRRNSRTHRSPLMESSNTHSPGFARFVVTICFTHSLRRSTCFLELSTFTHWRCLRIRRRNVTCITLAKSSKISISPVAPPLPLPSLLWPILRRSVPDWESSLVFKNGSFLASQETRHEKTIRSILVWATPYQGRRMCCAGS